MALRLRVISDHRRPLGERGTMTFGAAGGTIGRSSDNDWVLPDPQRYVSAHHARIHFTNGHFELEDTSTNGLFVNEDERPVREYGPYRLQHGDVLRLGQYRLGVALEPDAADPAEPSYVVDPALDPVPTQIDELRILGRAAQTDLGAALNLDDLLLTDSPSGRRPGPVNAYGQPVTAPPAPEATADAFERDAEAVARRIERLARAASRARDGRASSLPVPAEVQTGLQAFCRGAGIDSQQLPADAQARLLHLVGQLFREALVGLKDLERVRQEIHDRFHIDLPADPDDPRPSLVRTTVEELLVQVLAQHESRRIDAVQWIRNTIAAVKDHEHATSDAFRTAFVEFVGRFDPADLEARFERAARRGKAPAEGGTEPRYWALFAEFYRNLTEMPAGELPHVFVESFATAYKQVLLAPRRPTS